MSNIEIKPWEMGNEIKTTGLPPLCVVDTLLVKLAPPKGKDTRSGLVGGFLITAYYDDNNNKTDLITVTESAEGYSVEFPKGKKGIYATKYRGPKSYYRFKNPLTNKFYQIPQEKLTSEYAAEYLSEKLSDWVNLSQSEKDELVTEYMEDMFMFGLSQDLLLPIHDNGDFEAPVVGVQTKLYRIYTPPAEGEDWGNTIITKWHKGHPSLTSDYEVMSEAKTTAIFDAYTSKEEESFDPTNFVEKDDDVI